MYYVYLIQNTKTEEKYIGYTENPEKRIKTHNSRGNKFTTREDGTWVYVYLEVFRSQKDARNREQSLKDHGAGKRELFKRLENSFV